MIEFVYPHTHLVAGGGEEGRRPLVGAGGAAARVLGSLRPPIGVL